MKLILGDSLNKLKELDDNSVDSIVTDPPYGLSFMGKRWDYDVPSQEIWEECLRVLKPGGYLLAFAGTRTQHRMAVRIEDAGFEIRDMIAWVYGSGFPKSLNIGKSIEAKELTGSSNKTAFKHLDGRKVKVALGYNKNNEEGDFRPNDYNGRETTIDHILHTENAKKWEGWGTALKPSLEPITVARKPISEKTVAENVLKYGTGGINIDGCRVEAKQGEYDVRHYTKEDCFQNKKSKKSKFQIKPQPSGRFPANLITDGSDEVVGLFPDVKTGSIKPHQQNSKQESFGMKGKFITGSHTGDSGSASRFFYCAKASKSERNKGLEGFEEKYTPAAEFRPNHMEKAVDGENGNPFGRWQPVANNHPTVKPISLMRYLCKLVTPKGGTVLDPFMGSGTTGIGAKLEGFDFIGIEREEEYIKIAEARINAWQKENKLL